MLSYQKFWQFFVHLAGDPRTETIPEWSGYNKQKFWNDVGAMTEEDRLVSEQKRNQMLKQNVALGLTNCKVFEIDKVEKRLLLLTEAPHDKKILQKVKMPFNHIFIDVDFGPEELDPGFDFKKVHGLLISKLVERDADGSENEFIYLAWVGEKGEEDDQGRVGIFINDLVLSVKSEKVKIYYHQAKELEFFKSFVVNFLLFINNPDIEWVDCPRSKGNAARRERQGFIPLPSSTKIRLTGKIKRYATLIQGIGESHFDFRFWVRGHWRHHTAERYTEAKDKVIWIEPFMKGKGDIREKNYVLEADNEGEKEYEKIAPLYMDDIEPLEKPLHQILEPQRMKSAIRYRKRQMEAHYGNQ